MSIPESEYSISEDPLIKGQKVADGWWTRANGQNLRIKDMTDTYLKNAINWLKKRIREGIEMPPEKFPKRWIRQDLWALEQMIDEQERREEWKVREKLGNLDEDELIERLVVQLDVREVRD
jgi:hypothetical protein